MNDGSRVSPADPEAAVPRRARIVLLASVFIVASCGLVYELVAGAVSSYLRGDAVTQFSLVIGVFLSAMGVGSYLAQFVRRNLLATFVEIEIWVGLVGGASSMVTFAVGAFAEDLFAPVFYGLCSAIGILVGIEIPLLVRILGRGRKETAGAALSEVLALDYLGALVGALAFPFLALPWLGLTRSSVVFGLMNLAVAGVGILLLREGRSGPTLRLATATVLLLLCLAQSARWVGFLEDILYQDQVVFAEDSEYQRIVLTRWRHDVRLYLNGHLQFSSVDEARYHESLVIPAMEAVRATGAAPKTVLILGGGDGLAAREVLSYGSVERVVLVDLDPKVTELARQRDDLVALNRGSLDAPSLQVVHDDAFRFLRAAPDPELPAFYDVILADLPDPSTPTLAKLYSRAFYASALRRLSRHGVLVTQATSPFFARQAFWSVVETLRTSRAAELETEVGGVHVLPYHVHVPSFGEWGFAMASLRPVDPLALSVSTSTRFLDDDTLHALFVFPKDLAPVPVAVNRLEDPVLFRYYEKGWGAFHP